ncbi:MAG: hypothetical protein HUJ54_05935 [Erysipelotrichaceae bacterium]|nr:hypothetical protein [Erysipelotrichaceae bacterium]
MNQQIQSFMQENNGYILTCQNIGYEFLDQDEKWICFDNPYGSADIMWRFCNEEVFFFFGQWFERYPLDEDGIFQIVQLADSIMKDKCYLWQVDVNGQRVLSMVDDRPGTFFERSLEYLNLDFEDRTIQVSSTQIRSRFIFWDPKFMEQTAKSPFLN